MNPFKKGDRVRCIDNLHFADPKKLVVGEVYVVAATHRGKRLKLVGLDDYTPYSRRFVLACAEGRLV